MSGAQIIRLERKADLAVPQKRLARLLLPISIVFGLSPFLLLIREYIGLKQTVTSDMLAASQLSEEGEAYLKNGNVDLALSHFEKAARLDPKNSLNYL